MPKPTRLKLTLPPGTKIPDHIAIILDGNRRWARARGLPTLKGHDAGFQAGMSVARAARDLGVHTVTVWGFSTENWDRSPEEISYLMQLYWKMVEKVREEALKEDIRFIHLGRKDRFPKDLMNFISKVEEETKNNQTHIFNVALDYGGRDAIIRATQKIIQDRVPADKVDEKLFSSYLDTAQQPYPNVDLFIRPSGEQRTSGLLPWEMAYAEYYWELDHLPDMTPEKLRTAIIDYSRRRRRFGGNDKEEHLKFDPRLVAKLELDWRRALALGEGERFRDLVIRYVKEHYGLSKGLAKDAGRHLTKALLCGRSEDWGKARQSLEGLYGIVKQTLGLALEPDVVAGLEINLWKGQEGRSLEEQLRQLYAEIFRVSDFQASKAAHLSALARGEMDKKNWVQAQSLLEKFYAALKERVA